MKRINRTPVLIAFFVLLSPFCLLAQSNPESVTMTNPLAGFTRLSVSSALNVNLIQGNENQITITAPQGFGDFVKYEIADQCLVLSLRKANDPSEGSTKNKKNINAQLSKIKIDLVFKELNEVTAKSASEIKSKNVIQTDDFTLNLSGASNANLQIKGNSFIGKCIGASNCKADLDVTHVNILSSAASDVILSGKTETFEFRASGASDVKASRLVSDHVEAVLAGASDASVLARQSLKAKLSGASDLSFYDNGKTKKISATGDYQFFFSGMDDVQGAVIEDDSLGEEILTHNNDSTVLKFGSSEIYVGEDGRLDFRVVKKDKQQRFKGHWRGIDLGVNGYLTPDGNSDFPAGYEGLDLNYAKSIVFNLNFAELDQKIGSPHFGVVSGLGLSWHNYRFSDESIRLGSDNGFVLYKDTTNADFIKSKLMVLNLTVPLLLEYQTNSGVKTSSFHITAGVIGNLNIGAHAKYKYNNGSNQKDKAFGNFYLNPFSCDATVRIGWSYLNIFGTYALTPMFRSDKGPELYPFSVGITLGGWSGRR